MPKRQILDCQIAPLKDTLSIAMSMVSMPVHKPSPPLLLLRISGSISVQIKHQNSMHMVYTENN